MLDALALCGLAYAVLIGILAVSAALVNIGEWIGRSLVKWIR